MTRILRLFVLVSLVAACLALMGCNMRKLHVVIPDFETSQVIGVDVWRVDVAQPVDLGDITFGALSTYDFGGGSIEVIEYFVPQADGSQLTLSAQVFRDPLVPEAIEVHLYFPNDTPAGWYKVSTYNSFGSSPLSAQQTQLL